MRPREKRQQLIVIAATLWTAPNTRFGRKTSPLTLTSPDYVAKMQPRSTRP